MSNTFNVYGAVKFHCNDTKCNHKYCVVSNNFKVTGKLKKDTGSSRYYHEVKIIKKTPVKIDNYMNVRNNEKYKRKFIGPTKDVLKIIKVGDRFKGYRHDARSKNPDDEIDGIVKIIYTNYANTGWCHNGFYPRLQFTVHNDLCTETNGKKGRCHFMCLDDFLKN